MPESLLPSRASRLTRSVRPGFFVRLPPPLISVYRFTNLKETRIMNDDEMLAKE